MEVFLALFSAVSQASSFPLLDVNHRFEQDEWLRFAWTEGWERRGGNVISWLVKLTLGI